MKNAQNTFHFNPVRGLSLGLPVSEGVPTSRNDGSVHPPHVKCGDAYIIVDKVKRPLIQTIGGSKRVMAASIRKVLPSDGRSEFRTLATFDDATNIVLVELSSHDPHVVKDKFSWLNAWSGIVADSSIDTVISGSGGAILLFDEDGQVADVYLHNGAVYRLQQQNGTISVVPLSLKEMANLRIEQFCEKLDQLSGSDENDVRRRHGILWSASRLLRASQDDRDVFDILVDFLAENRPNMPDKLCQEIRSVLLKVAHPLAGTFVSGENVVHLYSNDSAASKRNRPKVDSKKELRRDRDRQERSFKKTTSGSQSKNTRQKS